MTKVSIELLRTGFKQDTVTCDISKNSNFEEDLQTTASKYEVISGPYFPAFGLNMERYEISLRIQSQCGKIRTRNYSVFGHFSRSEVYDFWFSSKEINFENALLNVLLFLNLSKKFKILNDNN